MPKVDSPIESQKRMCTEAVPLAIATAFTSLALAYHGEQRISHLLDQVESEQQMRLAFTQEIGRQKIGFYTNANGLIASTAGRGWDCSYGTCVLRPKV